MHFPHQSRQNQSISLFSLNFEGLRFYHFRQCILYYPMFTNSYFFIQAVKILKAGSTSLYLVALKCMGISYKCVIIHGFFSNF